MGFFDKLKGEIEEPLKKEGEPKPKKVKKPKPERVKIELEPSKAPKAEPPAPKKAAPFGDEPPAEGEARSNERRPEKSGREEPPLEPSSEGELAIDVYETEDEFVVQSTIAGIKPEDLDITVENDMVTVRGSRTRETEEISKKYYYQECYWGSFSRQVILPEEVDGSRAEATIKNGVLTLRIPKVKKVQRRKIAVKTAE